MITQKISGLKQLDATGIQSYQIPSIDQLIEEWLKTIDNISTRNAYKYGVARVIKLGNDEGKIFPWPLTASSLYALHKSVRFYVQEGKMRSATGNQSKTALCNLFDYLVLNKYIPLSEKILFNTMPIVRMPKDRGERKHKYVPVENVQEAIASANDRDVVMLEVFYLCGFRAREVVELKGRNIYLKDDKWHMEVRGKEGSIRHIPLSPKTANAIFALHGGKIADDMPLFGNIYNPSQPIGTEAVRIMMRRLFSSCGLDVPTPHWFRATFATDHLLDDTDLNVVQEMLGHAKAETTFGYLVAHMMELRKREAINKRSL